MINSINSYSLKQTNKLVFEINTSSDVSMSYLFFYFFFKKEENVPPNLKIYLLLLIANCNAVIAYFTF